MSPRIERAKCYVIKHWGVMVSLAMVAVLIGVGGQLVLGRTQPVQILVFGGNTDPGDGNGGGAARDQMVAAGWGSPENIYQIQWRADIGSGTVQASNDAMPAGKQAYAERCQSGCIIAGFSLGNSPAIQLRDEVGAPPGDLYMFGAPQPSTGIWHAQFQDNPFVEPGIQMFGKLQPDRLPPAGAHAWYDTHDIYANAAPQCQGPGLYALNVNPGHRIISRAEGDAHVWTGTDGVIMHEAGYTGPIGLPASGSDPSQPWAGCLAFDWKTSVNSPGDQPTEPGTTEGEGPLMPNGGSIPGLPGGVPSLPGVPSGG